MPASWRPNAELQGATVHGRGSFRAVRTADLPSTGLWDLASLPNLLSLRTKNDAEWQEVVALLNAAAPDVDVGPSLAAKMHTSTAHERFVDAVIQACRSQRAARLGIVKYTIDEERDAESPRWITIALTAWFADQDLDARMAAWAELRHIVDEYIVPLRDSDSSGEMQDIDSRFFISMGR